VQSDPSIVKNMIPVFTFLSLVVAMTMITPTSASSSSLWKILNRGKIRGESAAPLNKKVQGINHCTGEDCATLGIRRGGNGHSVIVHDTNDYNDLGHAFANVQMNLEGL
jgi:hypothetical protein